MAAPDVTSLLDAETIARAEALGLQARMIVEGYLTGAHRSPLSGVSSEFRHHREYVTGDDLRHLDWKLLGRTDRYYVKQHEQQTNFTASILLDASRSMRYGSGRLTKLDYGRMLAACLAYLVLHQGDAVTVGVFDNRLCRRVSGGNRLAAFRTVLELLVSAEATATTDIGAVLHEVAEQLRRRGIVLLISDLLDDEQNILSGIQHLRFNGHEVVVFHILDPHELELPFDGMIEFRDLEGATRVLTQPAEIRSHYLRELNKFCSRLRDGCERNRSHYVLVNTQQPLADMLGAYLAVRQRRRYR